MAQPTTRALAHAVCVALLLCAAAAASYDYTLPHARHPLVGRETNQSCCANRALCCEFVVRPHLSFAI